MPNYSMPTRIGYKALFFDLDSQSLPSFDSLQRNIEFSGEQTGKSLSQAEQVVIAKELAPLHHLCLHFGFKPLVSELALISDQRMLAPKESPFFSSYISFFVPNSDAIAPEYIEALTYMGTKESGFEQI